MKIISLFAIILFASKLNMGAHAETMFFDSSAKAITEITCGDWLERIEEQSGDVAMVTAWLHGFFTGIAPSAEPYDEDFIMGSILLTVDMCLENQNRAQLFVDVLRETF